MLDIRSEAPGRLSLHGHCGLAQAPTLTQALAALLDFEGVATLDLAGLDDLDTTALQLLLAFRRQRGPDVRIVGWSPALTSRLQLTGFNELV
jgi:anti-anti-sigma regulatory factor